VPSKAQNPEREKGLFNKIWHLLQTTHRKTTKIRLKKKKKPRKFGNL